MAARKALSRARILAEAMAVADRLGLAGVTMRNVADGLGVEAMALYRHVSGKNDMLDSLVELIVEEINEACAALPEPHPDDDWRAILRRRILVARATLLRHPWAPGLLSTHGTMGPALMTYFDAFGSIMRQAGFSVDAVHHALHAFGSRGLGFTSELFQPGAPAIEETEVDPQRALEELAAFAETMPFLAEMATQLSHDAATTIGWCDDQAEFEFGLDVLLDGLELRRVAAG